MVVNKVYRVGVDVGGTNTDCVVLRLGESDKPHRGIRGTFKTPTTPDVTEGIKKSIQGAIAASKIPAEAISAVMIGTTHFVNAVVQADERNLRKVGVLRICGPYTKENPPFLDFPPILRRIMMGHVAYLDGGLEYDTREIMPLDEAQIRAECQILKQKQITDIAIIGVFSPLDLTGRHEAKVKEIVLQEIPEADVVLSRDNFNPVGHLGFLERENATLLNTSILKFARYTIRAFQKATLSLGLTCPLFLTQNDGTITDVDHAVKAPIKTFSSGPTNSMAGAAYLSGLDMKKKGAQSAQSQIIVADIGGTTTDVCALLNNGFPRQAGTWVEIGGVRSSFTMPEVFSIALGGGTKIEQSEEGEVSVGPESVGHRLTTEARVFGGSTLTTTDVVVASGKANIGDASRVQDVSLLTLEKARRGIKRLLEYAVDSMKLSADAATVILVGGGSIVHMDDLDGVDRVIRPQFHDCANAVGAAIAKVSGHVDIIEILEGRNEDDVVKEACEAAKRAAVDAGAEPDQVEVVSVDNLPLEYVAMKATRLVIRAAGPLSERALFETPAAANHDDEFKISRETPETQKNGKGQGMSNREKVPSDFVVSPSASIDINKYRPTVDNQGTWWVSEIDTEFLATGCSILACGGGGPGYQTYIAAMAALRAGHRLKVVDIDTLPDHGEVHGSVTYGAPTVTLERVPSGGEAKSAFDQHLKLFTGKMVAQISIEIGGMNGIRSMLNGLDYDVPAIDGDYMGRAYPRLYIQTPSLFGESPSPCTQADGMGNVVTVHSGSDERNIEKIQRKVSLGLGLFSQICFPALTVARVKEVGVLGTTSLAWYIGRAVHLARQEKTGILKAIIEANPCGRVLYTGKITSVRRCVSVGGYTEGAVTLKPISLDEQEYGDEAVSETREMRLPFQNEYLFAEMIAPGTPIDKRGEVLCTVPELISLVGTDGYALGTQDLRYGTRVSVIAFAAHPHWYTPKGIEVGGPKEFGYKDMGVIPLGLPYYVPKRVTKEFRPRS